MEPDNVVYVSYYDMWQKHAVQNTNLVHVMGDVAYCYLYTYE